MQFSIVGVLGGFRVVIYVTFFKQTVEIRDPDQMTHLIMGLHYLPIHLGLYG